MRIKIAVSAAREAISATAAELRPCQAAIEISSSSLASLFLTFLRAYRPGKRASTPSETAAARRATDRRSPLSQSQIRHSSRPRITGIRSRIAPQSEFGVVVVIVKVSTTSRPFGVLPPPP